MVNVQGDEPFVNRVALQQLIAAFESDEVKLASLMKKIENPKNISDPNVVKLVTDLQQNALYFSRSPIPYYRDQNQHPVFYEHIGVYAFRKEVLMKFSTWPQTFLEKAEKLEQLRYLEHGVKIKMIEVFEETVKIDVPEDLEKAREFLKKLEGK